MTGRPITPAHRYLFSPANELITQVLHPIVSLIPEILRDSNQLLFELEDAATLNIYPGDEIYLVTGDVESLYTNIPRAECLAMLRQLPIPAFVLDLLELVFDNCIVRFAEHWFQQHDGFPMGIEPAPDVANLFMWLLVRRLGRPPPQLRLYRRLIDDLFLVWIGSRASLNAHLAAINALHPRIRITWTVSDRAADFLDLHIHLGERFYDSQGRADVRIHRKQLNRYLYIPARSFHKRSQHRAWIKAPSCCGSSITRPLRSTTGACDASSLPCFGNAATRSSSSARCSLSTFTSTATATRCSRSCRRARTAPTPRPSTSSRAASPPRTRDCAMHTMHTSRPRSRAPGARFYRTPWIGGSLRGPEALLLHPELVASARNRTMDDLFHIFTRDAPPPAFFLPLTSATAGLRWGNLTLTLTRDPLDASSTQEDRRGRDRDPREQQRQRILLVLRRPPSLGSRLRYANPAHAHPEPAIPAPPPVPVPKHAAAPPPRPAPANQARRR